jgi:hypothetical protein
LADTNSFVFNVLTQLNFFALWSFSLWWVGLAALLAFSLRGAFVVALATYTPVHVMLCPALQVGKAFVVW